MKPEIQVKNVKKTFKTGDFYTTVLRNVNVGINKNDFAVILGPSGAGKSTLLNIILGLEKPTEGNIIVGGKDLFSIDDEDRARLRGKKFGVVYQQANWIKALNVVENVALPLIIQGRSFGKAVKEAEKKLELVNLYKYAKYSPMELSGGQQQKVSLARALVHDPEIVVGDEPTGNLDTVSGRDLMNILKALAVYQNKTILIVTHNPDYKKYADKIISIESGMVKSTHRMGRGALDQAKEGLESLNMKNLRKRVI